MENYLILNIIFFFFLYILLVNSLGWNQHHDENFKLYIDVQM